MSDLDHQPSVAKQWGMIACIIFAGEIIFSLPFHLARFFRPTFLNSFELSNTQLGDIFAFYGVVAMLAYFPGGYLADRYSARKLMSLALIATAAGGLYLASFPTIFGLKLLFAYWGVTTILFFWSAMIKITRDVASHQNQGKAFGLLDGGRGLVAATMASVAVLLIIQFFPGAIDELADEQRLGAMRLTIYYYSALTLIAGVLIWFIVYDTGTSVETCREKTTIPAFAAPASNPMVWYQAGIVFCAYCGFKGLDYFGLYLVEAYHFTELESSELIAHSSFIRPVAAISAGYLADKFLPSKVLSVSFAFAALSYVLFIMFDESTSSLFLFVNIIFCFIIIFALRAVYFALLEQTQIAKSSTGISVGIISVVGFTPDIFFAPFAGRLLDNPDTLVGFQYFYSTLLALAITGMIIAYRLTRPVATHSP